MFVNTDITIPCFLRFLQGERVRKRYAHRLERLSHRERQKQMSDVESIHGLVRTGGGGGGGGGGERGK